MCKSYQEIIDDFNDHLKYSGRKFYKDFYVGVSKDAQKRLFDEHHVNEQYSWWIYRTAKDSQTARAVEKYFLDLGMRGGDGGGDQSSNMVYCYAVTPTTTE